MLRTRPSALAVLLICLVGKACADEPRQAGTVFIVGGVGGLDPLQDSAPQALPSAGVPHRIVVFTWTHGKLHPIRDLQDTPYLLQRADELAVLVAGVMALEPDRPVYLVGHSAGAALVLAAAEKLPPCSIERIILLSAAVSPTFNLCPALRATRREIVAFNSSCDKILLGAGTSLFGTVDRVYCCGAGMDGFVIPPDLDEEGCRLYRRLVQCHWHVEDILQGFGGGHNSPCRPLFLSPQVAPWLIPSVVTHEKAP